MYLANTYEKQVDVTINHYTIPNEEKLAEEYDNIFN